MRHRKVLNLYDTEPSHEDLLIYLEGIEGSVRQQQALLQMVMVGFRVIAFHESGDEAYYGVRNPDARAARKISSPRVQASRTRRVAPAIEMRPHSVPEPTQPEVSSSADPMKAPAVAAVSVDLPEPSSDGFPEQPNQEDEYNTLKILRMMDEGDD